MKRRLSILILVVLSFTAVHSQAPVATGQMHVLNGLSNKSWQTSSFLGISFDNWWSGPGGFTALSVPVGVQVTHQLNNNLFAFGRLSVAPAFVSFNSAFNNTSFNKSYPGSGFINNHFFGVTQRAEAGLFYINDQKTFSVSGRMFIERGTNSFYPSYGMGRYPGINY